MSNSKTLHFSIPAESVLELAGLLSCHILPGRTDVDGLIVPKAPLGFDLAVDVLFGDSGPDRLVISWEGVRFLVSIRDGLRISEVE